jgi:hypothetical protein
MHEHRGPVGGALLGAVAGCWIAAVTVGATSEGGWCNGAVIGLFVAGGLCLAAAVVVLTGPHREPKPERSAARQYAEVFLKEEGLWPSWWQRTRHPRTPVGELPVRVPASVRDAYRNRNDALYELGDELENNRRDLAIQLANGRTFGIMHPGTAWAKNSHVLNREEFDETRELVQDAYLRTHALNQKTQARYDAASHEDVNNPEWQKLSDEEVQERTKALNAVQKALAAVQAARAV